MGNRVLCLVYGVHEGRDERPGKSFLLDLYEQVPQGRIRRQRWPIRALRRKRIIDVDNSHNLSQQRNLVASQAVGIAAAVEPLVVRANDWPHVSKRL